METVDKLKTSKPGLLLPQKSERQRQRTLSKPFLDDCRRKYGRDIVDQTLEEFERNKGNLRNPFAWFEEACANNEYRRNVGRFEANWQAEKLSFAKDAKANPISAVVARVFERPEEKKKLHLNFDVLKEFSKTMTASDLVALFLRQGYDRDQIVGELKRLAESTSK